MEKKFTKITNVEQIIKGKTIRKYNDSIKRYEYHTLGDFMPNNNGYEVFPNGINYRPIGEVFYVTLNSLIEAYEIELD